MVNTNNTNGTLPMSNYITPVSPILENRSRHLPTEGMSFVNNNNSHQPLSKLP